MHNLADAVLDYYLFLYFADDNNFASERAIKLMELFDKIENTFSETEKQALKDAAKRRLPEQLGEIYQGEAIPHFPVEVDKNLFLHNIAQGWFDIPGFDDIRDPDEEPGFG